MFTKKVKLILINVGSDHANGVKNDEERNGKLVFEIMLIVNLGHGWMR